MKKTSILLLLAVFATSAMAVPAYPGKIVFTQPGSETTVSIYLKGDERVHWAETEDGYSLLHSDDGSLVYAFRDENGDMVATKMIATEIDRRSVEVNAFLKETPKHLRFSQKQVDKMLDIWKQVEDTKSGPKMMSDVTGEKKFLVILFEFSDKAMTHTKSQFRNLFNQVNYTTGGRTGSVHDYYYDVSNGLFSLNVDVVGPFTGSRNTAYYGSTDQGSQAFASEAVDSAAKYVDFSDYDNDHDGYIDGLHIIFAGYGEEAGASSDCIWSHKWNIFSRPEYNNTVIDVYSCSPECSGNFGGNITNIGVICHELGHVFGAPDFYDTDYAGSGGEFPGLGQWDIMSSGSWNRNGITPAQHNPYTKIFIYKWASCDTIDATPRKITLNPIENGNDYHRVNTTTARDFFLIENRQNIKWDNNIPGHGMLVYHIHPNANGTSVSNRTHPQQIYILAQTADTFPNSQPSSYGNLNSGTATYPGQYNRRNSLTDNTLPWFRPWSQQPNNIGFYNISENTTTKQVCFTVGNASPTPMDAEAEGIDQQSIALRWTPYGSYSTLVVIGGDDNTFGVPSGRYGAGDTIDGGGIVVYRGSATTRLVSGLQGNRNYHFRFYSCINDTTYSDGIDAEAATLNCDNNEWQYEDFESSTCGELPDCWSGDWAVDSILAQQALVCSGEGWHSVSSRPLAFGTIRNTVLHFKLHFGDNCDETTCLKTEYRKNATAQWQTLDSSTWQFGSATWHDIYLQLPDAGDNSRIRFSALTANGMQVAVDNIEILAGSLIYSTSDANGNINPRGYSVLADGDTIKYLITPLAGYQLNYVTMDGRAMDASIMTQHDNGAYEYNLTGVTGEHTINATFKKKVGIDSPEQPTLVAYPNPASETITVRTTPGTTVTLFDISGRRIAQQTAVGTMVVFNIQPLPQGIYLLRDDNTRVKIIKK